MKGYQKLLKNGSTPLKLTRGSSHALIPSLYRRMGDGMLLLCMPRDKSRTKKNAVVSNQSLRIKAQSLVRIGESLKLRRIKSREKRAFGWRAFKTPQEMKNSLPMGLARRANKLTKKLNTVSDIRVCKVEIKHAANKPTKESKITK